MATAFYWAEALRLIVWVLLVLLLSTPMIAEYAFASDIVPVLQKLFPFWKDKPLEVVLSDIFFIEAGLHIVFGTLVAGTVLYNSWANVDVRQVQFTDYIWNWRQIRQERNSSAGLIFGLLLLVFGVLYVSAAIVV